MSLHIPRIVKWYNGRLISDYSKFNSWSEDQFLDGVNGSTLVSKTIGCGSNPYREANYNKNGVIMKKFNLEEVKTFIANQSDETKIYLGADSERFEIDGVWYADYITAVVVHIDGRHGCKLFGEVCRERDYDQKKDKPAMRLMNEVYKVADLFHSLQDVLQDRIVEVHLDINPNEKYGSSCVVQQAIGYIKGTCNVVPMVKPKAFAASYAADRLKFALAA